MRWTDTENSFLFPQIRTWNKAQGLCSLPNTKPGEFRGADNPSVTRLAGDRRLTPPLAQGR